MNTAAKIFCVALAFILMSVCSFLFGTKMSHYENLQSIQKNEITSTISYEVVDVDWCKKMNRIKIPQGWIVRDGYSTFFIPDSNHIWKLK
jgi:hypothetical protein